MLQPVFGPLLADWPLRLLPFLRVSAAQPALYPPIGPESSELVPSPWLQPSGWLLPPANAFALPALMPFRASEPLQVSQPPQPSPWLLPAVAHAMLEALPCALLPPFHLPTSTLQLVSGLRQRLPPSLSRFLQPRLQPQLPPSVSAPALSTLASAKLPLSSRLLLYAPQRPALEPSSVLPLSPPAQRLPSLQLLASGRAIPPVSGQLPPQQPSSKLLALAITAEPQPHWPLKLLSKPLLPSSQPQLYRSSRWLARSELARKPPFWQLLAFERSFLRATSQLAPLLPSSAEPAQQFS